MKKKIKDFLGNINWEFVVETIVIGAATIVVNRYSNRTKYDNIIDFTTYSHKKENGYSDAISAILKSDMFSVHKRKSVECIKQGKTNEYYNAIVQVASDNSMFSSHRLNLIEDISAHE